MAKQVSNVEKEQKKQQRRFTIVYVVGLIAFIIMILIAESDLFNKKELNLNPKLLESVDVLNIDESKTKGNELSKMSIDYVDFLDKVEELNLKELKAEDFSFNDDKFKYVDTNYTYLASENSLELTRKEKEVFSYYIEGDISKIKLIDEKEHYLEFTSKEVSFSVNDETYLINITNDEYIINCSYEYGVYSFTKERYSKSWDLKVFNLINNDVEFTGYVFNDIEGYTLSDDKLEIIDSNNNSIPSTKYLDDNKTIYYTIINYLLMDNTSIDLLVVNNSLDFPLK